MELPTPPGQVRSKAQMMLNGHPFDLRLSRPAQSSAAKIMIVYVTGDGGWFGLSTDLFNWMADWNYPIVGFSARSYKHNLGHFHDNAITTPQLLVKDYKAIIAFAEERLGLAPTTKVILAGMSRGAGFSVVAAGEGGLDDRMAGLLAVALTKEEEHVHHRPHGSASAGKPANQQTVMVDTYKYLDRVSPFPVIVIQSTNDGYVTADEARKLFGPDTDLRKLRAVPAANHGFRNGCPTLCKDTENALKWITGFLPATLHH